MAVIAAKDQPGEIQVTVRDARSSVHLGQLPAYTEEDKSRYVQRIMQAGAVDILQEAGLTITVMDGEKREGLALQTPNSFMPLAQVPVGFVPVRKLELVCAEEQCLSWTKLGPEKKQVTVQAISHPVSATDQEILWKAVNGAGIETNVASVESHGDKAVITALGDGEFYVRCVVKNGTDKVKLISQIEFSIEDMGPAT